MEKQNRTVLVVIGVIAFMACLCAGLLTMGGTGALLWLLPSRSATAPTQPAQATEFIEELEPTVVPRLVTEAPSGTPSASPEPMESAGPSETPPGTTPAAGETLDPQVAQQMDEIEAQVVELRGLEPTRRVIRQLLSRDELRQHVIKDFEEENTDQELQDNVTSMAILGFLEPGFDLKSFMIDLYSEQILGFYDDETDEMFVVQGSGFEGPERLTYSHEFVHALQDQHFGTQTDLGCDDQAWEEDSERCAAYHALIEGDATVTEWSWLTEHATLQDWDELQKLYSSFQSPVYDKAPAFMQEDFAFPYTYGEPFVRALIDRGGQKAVDAAFKENPPLSTEQILHPEKYPDDTPVQVAVPDLLPLLGTGWREVDRGTMGEWSTYLILGFGSDTQTRLDSEQAQEASAGWGGDAYRIYFNEEDQSSVLVLDMVWDSQRDADEFRQAFRQYAAARFGSPVEENQERLAWQSDEGYTILQQDGTRTIWISAPSQELMLAISQEIGMP